MAENKGKENREIDDIIDGVKNDEEREAPPTSPTARLRVKQDEEYFGGDENVDTSDNEYEAPLKRAKQGDSVAVKKGFIWSIIPCKGDKTPELVRKCVFILSVVVAIVCLVIILMNLGENAADSAMNEEIRDIKEQALAETEGSISLTEEKTETEEEPEPEVLSMYSSLYLQNNDLIGWVKIDDTPIDYPVMQADDNDYYLKHNFFGEDSKLGAIFADYHVKFRPTKRPNNTVLYGHNINTGEYFAKLTNYYPSKYGSLNFYLTHPTVTFDTVYEQGTYKIFAAMFINTQESEGDVYEYYQKRSFKTKTEFYDFVGNVMDRSVFYTDVDLEYGDEFLTLSTCYYPYGNSIDTRFVVFARRVRDGESAEVNTDAAYINKSPLYFDYYYRVNGGSWAGRSWDTTLVKGFDEWSASPDNTFASQTDGESTDNPDIAA